MRMRGPDTDGRDGTRAHFARRRSGQLRRMVDGSRPGRGYGGVLGGYHRNHLRHRKDKNCPEQRRGVVMRSAAVVVTRPAISMIAIGLGMSHAFRMGSNLPVLESVGGVGHGQKRQTSKPNNAKSAPRSHAAATLSTGIAWSNPFHAPRQSTLSDGWEAWAVFHANGSATGHGGGAARPSCLPLSLRSI